MKNRILRWRRAIKWHVWGPVGSTLLHILVILALIKLVVSPPEKPTTEIEVEYMEARTVDWDPPLEQKPEPWDEPPEPVPTLLPPEPAPGPAPDEVLAPPAQDMGPQEITSPLAVEVPGALILKGLHVGRTDLGRKQGLDLYSDGLGRDTEPSVVKALAWLKNHQSPDGSWGPNKAAMTGLGLLTFLAHGETLSSEQYGRTVEQAVRFLLLQQDETGRFTPTDSSAGSYAQAIATYAISEAYALLRIPDLRPAMERAVQVILDGQQPGGGWDYRYAQGSRRDTSVAGWCIQALKAAAIAGAENPGLKAALDRAAGDMLSAVDAETGRFFYTDRSSHKTDSITAIGVLALQLMGRGAERPVRDGLRAMAGAACDWEQPVEWPMYAWYYITQAHFHQGGRSWQNWNRRFAPALVRHQEEDGRWESPGAVRGGVGQETYLGPVYSTTLAALSLQVYYRLLPTYKQVAVAPADAAAPDDVVVRVL